MTTYDTHYGPVHKSSVCKDDFPNIELYHQSTSRVIKLQKPAILSLQECEKKIKRKIMCSGTWRACSYQAELYASDPNRYAAPNTTLHTAGLAIDVATDFPFFKEAHRSLLEHGWHQVRPTDEPWHYSFRLNA